MKKKKIKVTWLDRLTAAVKRGSFTATDQALAVEWTSCAISEAPKRMRRPVSGIAGGDPIDDRLDLLGIEFGNAVEDGMIGEAIDTYHLIRERIRELKAA